MVVRTLFYFTSFIVNLSSSPIHLEQKHPPILSRPNRTKPGAPTADFNRNNPLLQSLNNLEVRASPRQTEDLNTGEKVTMKFCNLSVSELDIVDSLREAMKAGIPTQGLKKIPKHRIDQETLGRTCARLTPSYDFSKVTPENYPKFIHIPKNAGTMVEQYHARIGKATSLWGLEDEEIISENSVTHIKRMSAFEFENLKFPMHPYHMCSWWHRPIDWWRNEGYEYYNTRRTFCIVRNPFSKANSAANAFYNYHPPNCLSSSQTDIAITEWLQKQKKWALSFGGKNYTYPIVDCHWVTQVHYIFDDHGCRVCDDVVYFEKLIRQLTILWTAYGLDPQHAFEKTNDQRCTKSKVHEMEVETAKMIAEAYEMDFLAFGYSMDPGIL